MGFVEYAYPETTSDTNSSTAPTTYRNQLDSERAAPSGKRLTGLSASRVLVHIQYPLSFSRLTIPFSRYPNDLTIVRQDSVSRVPSAWTDDAQYHHA